MIREGVVLMIKTEHEAVLILEKWLKSRGMQTNIEIPFCGSYVSNRYSRNGTRWDLVAWNDSSFMAIEVKLKFSINDIDQTVAMLPACKEVYLAIVDEKIKKALRIWPKINTDYGIGLIGIKESSCKIYFNPKNIFPVRKNMESEMLRISKQLPRIGVTPGYRELAVNPGWRWNKPKKPSHYIPFP